MRYFSQCLSLLGTVTAVDETNLSFTLSPRSGSEVEVFVGPTTYYQVVSNLDNIARDRVAEPNVPPGDTNAREGILYGLKKYICQGRMVSIQGLWQSHQGSTRLEARAVWLLHSEPGQYIFEETHWWLAQTAQMADRILDHLFDARRQYTIEDFSRLYRTQLNILGQPVDDTVQECAVLSRLTYDLSTAYLITGSERYYYAAKAAVEYMQQAFRRFTNDGEHCFWAYGRRRLMEGERGESLLVASQGPDDVGTIPLYEQIYALAGLAQYYRVTLDWEVLEDIRRTVNTFRDYFHDSPDAKKRGLPGLGGYFSHLDPVTLRPDSPALGENRLQKNWNSVGDHIPAYLINLILTLDPLPQGDPRARQTLEPLLNVCWSILEETSALIVDKFPAQGESDYVNERFTADWQPIHTYRWQRNRAVVGHNLKIAWNLTRVANYFKTRAERFGDEGDATRKSDYAQRATRALTCAHQIAQKMAVVGLDQFRGGVFDCVERVPTNGMPTQFAWAPTKDFWQQEQGILAYLILLGAVDNDPSLRAEYLKLARECEAFWNIYFLDRERQGYYFRVTENGVPIVEGEYGRKGGHAIGYHAFELAYLAHVYTRAFVDRNDRTLCLYFKVLPNLNQTSINVLPDFLAPGTLRIARIRANGVDVTSDRKPQNYLDFQISLAGLAGEPKSGTIDLCVEFRGSQDAS